MPIFWEVRKNKTYQITVQILGSRVLQIYKRPLLLESQNNHTPVKLKHFTYTEDRDKIIVNDMTNIAIPQQCEYSFQYDESTLLQSELKNWGQIFRKWKSGHF